MSDTATLDKLVSDAVDLVNQGSITLADLLKAIGPATPKHPVPAKLPLPAVITDAQKAALDNLTKVFGKVVPTERRDLQPTEVAALWEERKVLDEIGKLAEKRKAAIRTAVFNHFDVKFEERFHAESGMDGLVESADFDKDGHYISEEEVPIPDSGMVFRREVNQGGPTITTAALVAAEKAGDITHEEFLALTRQERVVDEHKVMAALKKNPALIHVLAQRATPGTKTAAFWPRQAKQ